MGKKPEKLKKIRLGSVHNILQPRGSMKKNSLGFKIYETLKGEIDWWTRPDYADTPPLLDVLATAKKNLDEETKGAWDQIINDLLQKDDLITFLTILVVQNDKTKEKEVYEKITKSIEDFKAWIDFADNLKTQIYFGCLTHYHITFWGRAAAFPKYQELYEEIEKRKGGNKE